MIPRVGRKNVAPKKSPSNRRRSGIGGAGCRSSVVPPSGGIQSRANDEPRPINDKVFQQDCIKRLLQFLRKNEYDNVTNKNLSRPLGKDFANIVTSMLRLIDPYFQSDSNPMKLEDEVAMNFKAIGYPFPISKTALVAAGSLHSWPTLLPSLTWFMEHIECLKKDK